MSRDDWLMLILIVSFLVLTYINLRVWRYISGGNRKKKWPKVEVMGDYDPAEQVRITEELNRTVNRQSGYWDDEDIQ